MPSMPATTLFRRCAKSDCVFVFIVYSLDLGVSIVYAFFLCFFSFILSKLDFFFLFLEFFLLPKKKSNFVQGFAILGIRNDQFQEL